jgi:endo-1,4-beta-xylanase
MAIKGILAVTSGALLVLTALCCTGQPDRSSLKGAFKNHFLIGAAVSDDVASGKDPMAAALVTKHSNTVTAENAMKWEHIHPALREYDFGPADRFVAFGMKNKMHIVGHALVWHSQIPDQAFMDDAQQLVGRDTMLARMHDHIATVVGRYKGKVHGWDVVNEALTDEGQMQQTKWMQTIGPDYVAKAFEYAHEADPDAELYYNDFSLDKPAKRDAAVRLVKELKSHGLRVDGIGIQGHWGMDYPTTENLNAFIDSVAGIGVKVMVTEMDVDILPVAWDYVGADINVRTELRKELNPYVDGLPVDMQKKLADRYAELFTILVKHAAQVDRVTIWGVYDKTSWLNNWPVRGRTSYPLLFDRNYEPKPAFHAVLGTAGMQK